MTRRLGVRAALVDGQLVAGDVAVDDDSIAQVGVDPPGRAGVAVPGFVDLQVNGFAGFEFLTCDVDGYRRAASALAGTGVTAVQPTFVSAPEAAYRTALATAARAQQLSAPRLLGVHLEGPFLAPEFAGAHDPAHLLAPDRALADRLCALGPVTCMTLAPERPGGLELVSHLVRRGLTVSLGHCDADAATAHAAYDRGARAVTHVHNAQRRWRARDPGVSGVATTRRDVAVQAIVDGVHLAAETVVSALLAAAGRFVLVTDAIEAAGRPDGTYQLGGRAVRVANGAARLGDGTLAGSVLTMDQAVRNLVGLGASQVEALDAAGRIPALLVGRPELATLRPGTPADIAVVDEGLFVHRTLVAGVERYAR